MHGYKNDLKHIRVIHSAYELTYICIIFQNNYFLDFVLVLRQQLSNYFIYDMFINSQSLFKRAD